MMQKLSILIAMIFSVVLLQIHPTKSEQLDSENMNQKKTEKIKKNKNSYKISPDLVKEIEKLEKKYPQKDLGHLKYDRSGHEYTTYIVSFLALRDQDRAYKLAFFSQYPDDEVRFSATRAFLNIRDPKYRKQIMAILHSLHGGDHNAVLKRRADLKKLIISGIKNKTLKDHQIGLIIHAFADSYAHVTGDEDNLEAFGHFVGHLWHGHKPDIIAYAPERFRKYVCNLYQALAPTESCLPVLTKLNKLIEGLETNRDGELAKFETYVEDELYFIKADYEKYSKKWGKSVDKDDVIKTIKVMEEATK